jgi:hypothetical protein
MTKNLVKVLAICLFAVVSTGAQAGFGDAVYTVTLRPTVALCKLVAKKVRKKLLTEKVRDENGKKVRKASGKVQRRAISLFKGLCKYPVRKIRKHGFAVIGAAEVATICYFGGKAILARLS